jgi:plasmid stability protein
MAQVIVRNLEDDVKAVLKRRAKQHGWSMEEEVRQILRRAVNDLVEPFPELSGQYIAPMSFG